MKKLVTLVLIPIVFIIFCSFLSSEKTHKKSDKKVQKIEQIINRYQIAFEAVDYDFEKISAINTFKVQGSYWQET
jgi:hypothetical protein